MTLIYKIVDKETNETYVGSTKQKIHRRMVTHKKPKNECSSKQIIDKCNYEVIIIEECEEENRKVREQYWIDKIDCVNIKNVIYDEKKYKRDYYEKHIDEKKQYDKIRRNWKMSFCETKRDVCNLTYINTDLFT